MDEILEHRIEIPELTEAEIEEAEQYSPSPLSSSLFMSLIPQSCIPKRRLSRISVTNYHHHHHHHNNNNHRNTARRAFRFFGYKKWTLILYGFCFLVFIFFFLLWWFSSSGGLPIKDGRIVEIVSEVKHFSLNNTAVELRRMSFMENATPPNPNTQLIMQ